jgi:hypothetical protein
VDFGLFKKVSNRIEFPDGTKQFAKTIYSKPEEYFTETVMAKLEEYVKKEYQYGLGSDPENDAVDESIVVEDELAESLNLIDSEVE